MKYLKTYKLFESKVDHYDGLTKEDIEDMFIDVHDMGYRVDVSLSLMFVYLDIEKDTLDNPYTKKLGQIPYIEVCISSPNINQMSDSISLMRLRRVIKDLNESDEFKSIIDEVNSRVSVMDWYISKSDVVQNWRRSVGPSLQVHIHRKRDSRYIKIQ